MYSAIGGMRQNVQSCLHIITEFLKDVEWLDFHRVLNILMEDADIGFSRWIQEKL